MSSGAILVVNADDFGMSAEVNLGILTAYRCGLLQSCSLMVAERAAAEAVEIARQYPGLAVGLHVALTDAVPCLPAAAIPELVGADGRFHPTESVLRRRLAKSSAARRQMRQEIRAQFDAFRKTGLVCDHVDGHRNVELDPFVAIALFDTARRVGVWTVRVPRMPRSADRKGIWSGFGDLGRYLRARSLQHVANRFGLTCFDYSVDLKDVADLRTFSAGFRADAVIEVYAHPAAQDDIDQNCWNSDLRRLAADAGSEMVAVPERPPLVGFHRGLA